MTLDDLELGCHRQGLTRPQTEWVLLAAGSYATAQAVAALAALGHAVMHWQVHRPVSGPACGVPGVCTTVSADVTCANCKRTQAWKAAA